VTRWYRAAWPHRRGPFGAPRQRMGCRGRVPPRPGRQGPAASRPVPAALGPHGRRFGRRRSGLATRARGVPPAWAAPLSRGPPTPPNHHRRGVRGFPWSPKRASARQADPSTHDVARPGLSRAAPRRLPPRGWRFGAVDQLPHKNRATGRKGEQGSAGAGTAGGPVRPRIWLRRSERSVPNAQSPPIDPPGSGAWICTSPSPRRSSATASCAGVPARSGNVP
jgi:hypothetical protein